MKKLFIMGKVYDIDDCPIEEIKTDIENRLFDFTKNKMPVSIEVKDNYAQITIHRGINVELHDKMILEQDSWILTGEGYNGFSPVYSMPNFSHYPDMVFYLELDKFTKVFKNNAEHYTGSKLKKVSISELPTSLTITTFLK